MLRLRQVLLSLLCIVCVALVSGCGSTSGGSFTLNADSSSITVAQGSSTSFHLSAAGSSHFKGTVNVTVSGLPQGVTLTPASPTITPGTPAALTLQASSTAAVGTATVTFSGSSGSIKASTSIRGVGTATSGGTLPPTTPDFVLTVAPSTLSLNAGQSGPVTLTATAVQDFTGPVSVTITGLPAGVTASPATISLTPGTPLNVTLSADNTVTTTNTPATVSFAGVAGALNHTATLALSLTAAGSTPPPPPPPSGDFSISLDPSAVTLTAGGATATTTASIGALNGFTGQVSVEVRGLPAGVSISPATANIAAGASQDFVLTADGTAVPGTTSVTFTGTQGNLTHTAKLALTIAGPPPVPDFSLSLAPPAVSAAPGGLATATLSATALQGFSGSIAVVASGLPAGVTLSPSTISLNPGTPVTLNLAVDLTAAAGTSTIVLTGTSGSLTHTISLSLTIAAPTSTPDFVLTITPASLSIAAGGIGQSTLSALPQNGFTGQIDIAANGLPDGVTLDPATTSLAPNTPQAITFTVSANAVAGTYNVVLTGTAGTLSHSATVVLTILAADSQDFGLALTPGTLTIVQGASDTTSLAAAATGGFAGTIQVTASGAPDGVVLGPSSFNLVAGTPAAITVGVATTVPAGTYSILLTGTSGSLTHTVTLTLTVNPAQSDADFSLSVTPNTATVAQGDDSGTVDIAVNAIKGFNGDVTFTVAGLPDGVIILPPNGDLQQGQDEQIVFRAADTAAIGNATVTITGVSGSLIHTAVVTLTVTPPPAPQSFTLTLTPSTQSVVAGSTTSIAVSVAESGFAAPANVVITGVPDGVVATPATFAVSPGAPQTVSFATSIGTQAGPYTLTFTGRVGSINTQATLNLTVNAPTSTGVDVSTWHMDSGRSGLNNLEAVLTPGTVTQSLFGKVGSFAADASVDAQPLYISGLTINSQLHNVIYVASEKDSVYAYDADNGTLLWQISALAANETPTGDRGCSDVTSNIGITGTPVIDRNFQTNGAMFFVAASLDKGGAYHQRLHAVDLTTGAELSGSPIEITATAAGNGAGSVNGVNTFDPSKYVERAALLLNNGTLYLSWAAPCAQGTSSTTSWVLTYDEATFHQDTALNLTPNGSGGSIGMSGSGPAGDAAGHVIVLTGTGTFDTTLDGSGNPQNGDYGNGYVKLQTVGGVTTVTDYFEPANGVPGSANYQDQGSGGILLAPGFALGIGAGRDGNLYEMATATSKLGGYAGGGINSNYNTLLNALPSGASATPSILSFNVYFGGINDHLKSFSLFNPLAPVVTETSTIFSDPGTTPVISANNNNGAVLWALESVAGQGSVLHAYDPANLGTEFYNSSQAQSGGAARDAIGPASKYAVPIVVNGHVYVGTANGVVAFGALP